MIGVLIAAVIAGAVARAVGEGGQGAARGGSRRGRRGAGDERELRAAVRAGADRRRRRTRGTSRRPTTSRWGGRRRVQRRRARTARRASRVVPGRGLDRAGAGARGGHASGSRSARGAARHRLQTRRRRRGRARPGRGDRRSPPAAGTAARSRTGRASRCAPTSRRPSTGWSRPRSADGVSLTINSAFRSDAEQAVLFARHPDPKWVARPGTSLHRNGTELDLGPPAAYGVAGRERHPLPLHPALRVGSRGISATRSTPRRRPARAATARRAWRAARCPGSCRSSTHRSSAPPRSAGTSPRPCSPPSSTPSPSFNPFAVSRAGAQGIAQFMPGTARRTGSSNPFDAEQAINAQAHLMRDLLRQFG